MERFKIGGIPAVLYGEPCEKAYLFIHGKHGYKEEGEAFAQIACPVGYQVLAIDLPEYGERKTMQNSFNPWTVVPELQAVLVYMKNCWCDISLRANSIGAYFSLLAFGGENIRKTLFASPIVDMEKLIGDMMTWAGVTEDELREKGEILTNFGETLSWQYLNWVQGHPIKDWNCPTVILYAGRDNLTARQGIDAFSVKYHATLSIMENGEHWFHTPEQLEILTAWERDNIMNEVLPSRMNADVADA